MLAAAHESDLLSSHLLSKLDGRCHQMRVMIMCCHLWQTLLLPMLLSPWALPCPPPAQPWPSGLPYPHPCRRLLGWLWLWLWLWLARPAGGGTAESAGVKAECSPSSGQKTDMYRRPAARPAPRHNHAHLGGFEHAAEKRLVLLPGLR